MNFPGVVTKVAELTDGPKKASGSKSNRGRRASPWQDDFPEDDEVIPVARDFGALPSAIVIDRLNAP